MNIVIGSGRCGTVSIAKLLNGYHELQPVLPWEKDIETYKKHIKKIKSRPEDTFVAFYYLRYLDDLYEDFDNLKAICLKRDKQETVNSLLKKTEGYNHWKDHNGEYKVNEYEDCFPKYGDIPKRQAVEKYWEEYYQRVEEQGVKTIDIKKLNSEEGQQEIFNHFNKEYKGFKKVHYNKS